MKPKKIVLLHCTKKWFDHKQDKTGNLTEDLVAKDLCYHGIVGAFCFHYGLKKHYNILRAQMQQKTKYVAKILLTHGKIPNAVETPSIDEHRHRPMVAPSST
jgi:hypothetical protein